MVIPYQPGQYELASDPLDPRDTELNIEAANMLHGYLTREYFPWLMSAFPGKELVPELTESRDVLAFGASFGPYKLSRDDPDNDLEFSRFTGIRLVHDKNTWSMRARINKARCDGTPNKTSVRYAVDVEGPWVLQAQVGADVLTNSSDDFFGQLLSDSLPEPAVARKAYERHMTLRDCLRLQRSLRSAAQRRLITAKRSA